MYIPGDATVDLSLVKQETMGTLNPSPLQVDPDTCCRPFNLFDRSLGIESFVPGEAWVVYKENATGHAPSFYGRGHVLHALQSLAIIIIQVFAFKSTSLLGALRC